MVKELVARTSFPSEWDLILVAVTSALSFEVCSQVSSHRSTPMFRSTGSVCCIPALIAQAGTVSYILASHHSKRLGHIVVEVLSRDDGRLRVRCQPDDCIIRGLRAQLF